jgi:hypothetical protein
MFQKNLLMMGGFIICGVPITLFAYTEHLLSSEGSSPQAGFTAYSIGALVFTLGNALVYWASRRRMSQCLAVASASLGILVAVTSTIPHGLGAVVGLLSVCLFPFIVLPLVVLVISESRSMRSHSDSANQCSRCGYDLTGNISGTCPECGTSLERLSRP